MDVEISKKGKKKPHRFKAVVFISEVILKIKSS
jgi:hypothetical protein